MAVINQKSCKCNGEHYFVVHDNTKCYLKGNNRKFICSPYTIEYFDTELEMEERIAQLDLDLSLVNGLV